MGKIGQVLRWTRHEGADEFEVYFIRQSAYRNRKVAVILNAIQAETLVEIDGTPDSDLLKCHSVGPRKLQYFRAWVDSLRPTIDALRPEWEAAVTSQADSINEPWST